MATGQSASPSIHKALFGLAYLWRARSLLVEVWISQGARHEAAGLRQGGRVVDGARTAIDGAGDISTAAVVDALRRGLSDSKIERMHHDGNPMGDSRLCASNIQLFQTPVQPVNKGRDFPRQSKGFHIDSKRGGIFLVEGSEQVAGIGSSRRLVEGCGTRAQGERREEGDVGSPGREKNQVGAQ